jgi:hypothetical protein
MLSDENKKLKQAQRTMFCPVCAPPAQNQLPPDMQRLKEQNNWLKLDIQNIEKPLRHFRLSFSNNLTFGRICFKFNNSKTQLVALSRFKGHERITMP